MGKTFADTSNQNVDRSLLLQVGVGFGGGGGGDDGGVQVVI